MAYSRTEVIARLKGRRDAIFDELNSLSASKSGGLPNQSGLPISTDHVGYKDGLYRELKEIQDQLNFYEGAWSEEQFADP